MYDGFFIDDLMPLITMCISLYILGSSLIRIFRTHTKSQALTLWDDLTRWYLQLKCKKEIPGELEICFDTQLNDDKEFPVLTVNVYYNSMPVFNFTEELKSILSAKHIKKKVMNTDFRKLTTKAYNIYMERIINDLDSIRPD